jgi:hypothetical protein
MALKSFFFTLRDKKGRKRLKEKRDLKDRRDGFNFEVQFFSAVFLK